MNKIDRIANRIVGRDKEDDRFEWTTRKLPSGKTQISSERMNQMNASMMKAFLNSKFNKFGYQTETEIKLVKSGNGIVVTVTTDNDIAKHVLEICEETR